MHGALVVLDFIVNHQAPLLTALAFALYLASGRRAGFQFTLRKGLYTLSAPILLAIIGQVHLIPATFGLSPFESVCTRNSASSALLFIHGWNGDAHATWRQFARLACSDQRLARVDILSADYPTFMARRNLRTAQIADWLYSSL